MQRSETGEALRRDVEVEVRYAETDAMGIVHHANYPVWFELARTHLCLETGESYAEIERSGHQLTVTEISVRYRRPARYGDTVRISAHIDRLGSRAVGFAYSVTRDSTLLATGRSEHVWIDRAGKPCRMPERLLPAFRAVAGLEHAS